MKRQTSTMTRRDFLQFAGKTAVISSGFLAGCAATSTPDRAANATRAIDIHHHYFAPELIDEIKQHGKALGIEYFPPKDAKANPFQFQFPKGNRLSPDPRMAEVENRLKIMSQGHIGIATLEVHTASVGYELDGQRGQSWSNALQ